MNKTNNRKIYCRACNKIIKKKKFKDKLSLQEFLISGFCQNCQDKTFK